MSELLTTPTIGHVWIEDLRLIDDGGQNEKLARHIYEHGWQWGKLVVNDGVALEHSLDYLLETDLPDFSGMLPNLRRSFEILADIQLPTMLNFSGRDPFVPWAQNPRNHNYWPHGHYRQAVTGMDQQILDIAQDIGVQVIGLEFQNEPYVYKDDEMEEWGRSVHASYIQNMKLEFFPVIATARAGWENSAEIVDDHTFVFGAAPYRKEGNFWPDAFQEKVWLWARDRKAHFKSRGQKYMLGEASGWIRGDADTKIVADYCKALWRGARDAGVSVGHLAGIYRDHDVQSGGVIDRKRGRYTKKGEALLEFRNAPPIGDPSVPVPPLPDPEPTPAPGGDAVEHIKAAIRKIRRQVKKGRAGWAKGEWEIDDVGDPFWEPDVVSSRGFPGENIPNATVANILASLEAALAAVKDQPPTMTLLDKLRPIEGLGVDNQGRKAERWNSISGMKEATRGEDWNELFNWLVSRRGR